MDNHVLITSDSCLNIDSKQLQVCLPPRELCITTPTDGILAECGKEWNCNLCGVDGEYLQPFRRGDKIQIQTNIFDSYNPNPQQPTASFTNWIRVTFVGEMNTTSSLAFFTSRTMTAYGCGKSYQIIEIDTSLFPDCRFKVKFEALDDENNVIEEYCSQEFGEVDDCLDTVLIRGKHTKKDCFGTCYGVPDAYFGDLIPFDNSLRFYGYWRNTGGSFTKTIISNNRVSSITLQESFEFQLGRKIPPFASNILLKQMFAGDTVCLDGEEFTVDSFSIQNRIEKGRMFLYGVEVFRQCEDVKGCKS